MSGNSLVFFYFEVCDPPNLIGEQNLKPKLFEQKGQSPAKIILLGNRRLTNAFELDLSVADPFHCDMKRSGMSQYRKGYFDKVTNFI